ncbi:helix-turn-helix domain-containing protein [Nocardia bovistercoris]|uniref:Helix-turn-helix transcriptional regulator n=1 Tax=Nocardia bovistercoris TaxID=2785916 RepID=A0A931N4I8_9NOCA|nr:helix-turn-helix transcriptional regulator [Nocardia bovistercoris]MBH0778747.1 helix-turn-helix transcriptional regulator [Nocardia bovistercoris]
MGAKETATAINRAVGNELRAARARRDLTRQQLADLTGLAVSTIQRFENGERSPDMQQLHALCGALDIPMREFVSSALRDIERPND